MPARRLIPVLAALGFAILAACSSEESGPYFMIEGGGFLFNYRLAEATAGVAIFAKRTLPEGGRFEATLVNPDGGAPLAMAEPVVEKKKRYDFTTPPLTGVKANTDYLMTVRLFDASGSEIARVEKPLRSEIDQSILPAKPLTIGPGYARNPGAEPAPAKPQ